MPVIEIDSSEDSSIVEINFLQEPLDDLSGIYQVAASLDKVSINKSLFYSSDLLLLLPGRWLNDRIINAYFELLSVHYQTAFYFSTFLFPSLLQNPPDRIFHWYCDIDFSKYDCFFVPVNSSSHWSLVKIEGNKLTGFDSMGEVPSDIIRIIKRFYVTVVLRHNEEKVSFYTRPTLGKIPKQTNSDDCGVFCCTYAKHYVNEENYKCFGSKDIPRIRQEILHEILAGKIIYK